MRRIIPPAIRPSIKKHYRTPAVWFSMTTTKVVHVFSSSLDPFAHQRDRESRATDGQAERSSPKRRTDAHRRRCGSRCCRAAKSCGKATTNQTKHFFSTLFIFRIFRRFSTRPASGGRPEMRICAYFCMKRKQIETETRVLFLFRQL